jgi:hypothetical protein
MASDKDRNLNQSGQLRTLTERMALNDAYGSLLGQQTTQSFSAFTFEEAVDAQIERIEGKSTSRRPNLLERVDRIEQATLQAIEVLKKTPPEEFREPDEEQDVNTPRDK